jgi:uncharacterized protein (TIGR03546 family)
MLAVKFILKFIRILNKDASPGSIAAGLALGLVWGLLPKFGIMGVAVMTLALVLTVNFSAALVSAAAFTVVAWAGDPLFNKIGYALLTTAPLKGLWTALYNTPVVPWTRFNNTLVMGSLATGLVLMVPAFFAFRWGVVKYRERVLAAVQKWKIVQVLKASKLYGLYSEYS